VLSRDEELGEEKHRARCDTLRRLGNLEGWGAGDGIPEMAGYPLDFSDVRSSSVVMHA
jgi:hypothetical protein